MLNQTMMAVHNLSQDPIEKASSNKYQSQLDKISKKNNFFAKKGHGSSSMHPSNRSVRLLPKNILDDKITSQDMNNKKSHLKINPLELGNLNNNSFAQFDNSQRFNQDASEIYNDSKTLEDGHQSNFTNFVKEMSYGQNNRLPTDANISITGDLLDNL